MAGLPEAIPMGKHYEGVRTMGVLSTLGTTRCGVSCPSVSSPELHSLPLASLSIRPDSALCGWVGIVSFGTPRFAVRR